jgi:phage terminase large subunit-like protein
VSLLGPLVDLCESSPLDWYEWLPAQDAYLRSPAKRKLLRTGNQAMGKTTVGCADLLYCVTGSHPYRKVRPPPVHWWVISSSERSSGVLQKKLWDLTPKAQVEDGSFFDEGKGAFHGKYPTLRLRNGSEINFLWTGSRTLNLAGASLDGVWFDEPPSKQRAFTELERRLTRTGGELFMTFTPVNAPVDYIREFCKKGKIADLHFGLKPEHLIPVGRRFPIRTGDGTPMDAAWIAEQRSLVADWEAPVVLDGEWEFRTSGSVFTRWDPREHVGIKDLPDYPLKLVLGVDYGDEKFREIAVFVAVDDTQVDSGGYPVIRVLGEYASKGTSTTREDARAILAMLRRKGIRWSSLDYVHGDKRYTGRKDSDTEKTNEALYQAICAELGVEDIEPQVDSAKKGKGAGAGSRQAGTRFIHEAMLHPGHFQVAEDCPVVQEAIEKWAWTEPYKDPIDALRYALRPWIIGTLSRDILPSTVRIRR